LVVTVAPTPDFYRWSFASMWTPGRSNRNRRAYYYLTDADPAWPEDKQRSPARLQLPDAWSILIHEVIRHFLHYQHLRRVE
jgi:hypothetical protein